MTADFYKHFSEYLCDVLAVTFNFFENKELSISQKIAIITLLFKKGDTALVGNYQPISLTNSDYKILAYILVAHLEHYLPSIIHPNQTVYMKEKFISTNIRPVQDYINFSSTNSVILFLDFRKAFDCVNHLFLLTLLLHMGFPTEFILWVSIMYGNASSMVKYKNWLTPAFQLQHGVRQGCPLSCHLFNIVGQILIYSLQDSGYFEWWTFISDPSSLYADDTAIFLHDISQLACVLKHIQWVGTFTGLELNLQKTVAFISAAMTEKIVAAVSVRSVLVKYLGAFLGQGDLSKLNFKAPLKKACAVISKWKNRYMTLDARILILKVYVFSVFTHILNVTFITAAKIDLIQKMISEFIW